MYNQEVTSLLEGLQHPINDGIIELRSSILDIDSNLEENIKWNGPNYALNGKDRITLRVQSPKLVQVILHLGAKTEKMPEHPLIEKTHKFIELKGNDRVILTFKSNEEITEHKTTISNIIEKWLYQTS